MRKQLPFDPDPVIAAYDIADRLHEWWHERRMARLLEGRTVQPTVSVRFPKEYQQQVMERIEEKSHLLQYPNLWFDIEEARRLALAKFRRLKQEAKAHLLEILVWLKKINQKRSLRNLAAMIGVAPNTVRAYRLQLTAAGLAP